MTSAIALIERLKDIYEGDHERGCQGREYDCECGYDEKVFATAKEAAAELTKLRAAMTEAARMLKHDYSHDDDGYGVAEYLERILGGGE